MRASSAESTNGVRLRASSSCPVGEAHVPWVAEVEAGIAGAPLLTLTEDPDKMPSVARVAGLPKENNGEC